MPFKHVFHGVNVNSNQMLCYADLADLLRKTQIFMLLCRKGPYHTSWLICLCNATHLRMSKSRPEKLCAKFQLTQIPAGQKRSHTFSQVLNMYAISKILPTQTWCDPLYIWVISLYLSPVLKECTFTYAVQIATRMQDVLTRFQKSKTWSYLIRNSWTQNTLLHLGTASKICIPSLWDSRPERLVEKEVTKHYFWWSQVLSLMFRARWLTHKWVATPSHSRLNRNISFEFNLCIVWKSFPAVKSRACLGSSPINEAAQNHSVL